MLTVLHHAENGAEPFEVELFGGSEGTFFEERDDPIHQIRASFHTETTQRFTVARVVSLLNHVSAPEDLCQVLENVPRPEALCDGELMLDLPT